MVLLVASPGTAAAGQRTDAGTRRASSAESEGETPPPGQARGTITATPPPPDPAGRRVARAVLWLPRFLYAVVSRPVHYAVLLNERYKIHPRLRRIFFNDTGTFGAYPLAFEETGFGLNAGARVIYRSRADLARGVRLRASFGGRYEQLYSAHVGTGRMLGSLQLELSTELSLRNRERFYAIGNGDVVPLPPAPEPVVPGAAAVETRFRLRHSSARMDAGWQLGAPWRAVLSGTVDHYTFSTRDVSLRGAADIADAFQLDTIPGFQSGVDLGTVDLELRYDTRHPGPLLPPTSVAGGAMVSLFGGYGGGVGEGKWGFVHYGGEAQLAVDLYAHTRVLMLRGLLVAVHGDYQDIPMVALPRLGGRLLLRGYATDRFRDRVAALTSAEYSWQVSDQTYAFLFVDAGEVSGSVADLRPGGVRVGFGAGLHLFGPTGSRARVQLASSVDGGIFAQLVLDNLLDPLWRKEIL